MSLKKKKKPDNLDHVIVRKVQRKHVSHSEADHYCIICKIAAVKVVKFSSCGVMLSLN